MTILTENEWLNSDNLHTLLIETRSAWNHRAFEPQDRRRRMLLEWIRAACAPVFQQNYGDYHLLSHAACIDENGRKRLTATLKDLEVIIETETWFHPLPGQFVNFFQSQLDTWDELRSIIDYAEYIDAILVSLIARFAYEEEAMFFVKEARNHDEHDLLIERIQEAESLYEDTEHRLSYVLARLYAIFCSETWSDLDRGFQSPDLPDDPNPRFGSDAIEQYFICEFQKIQIQILRDVYGNPHLRGAINPRWLSRDVESLIHIICEQRDFYLMPILADALLDADCDNKWLIEHCHMGGAHSFGCWAIAVLQGKWKFDSYY